MESRERLFRCLTCPSAFERKEHLDRHAHRHSGSKPFACNITGCGKAFARRDTLMRHMSIHGSDAVKDPSPFPPRQRGLQACLSCSKAKQRCQGGIPCTRCLRKRLSCYCLISSPPRRPKADINATSDAESTISTGTPHSLKTGTVWQAIETSQSSIPSGASNHPDDDINHLPFSGPIDSGPSLLASTHSLGPSVVSYHADCNGLIPAQANDMINSELMNFDNGDLNFDFDTFSVPFEELARLDQGFSSQYYDIMPSAHPFIRQTQETQSKLAFQDSDHSSLLSHMFLDRSLSDRSIQKLVFPELQAGDEDILAVEDFRHVKKISERSYQAIRQFYAETQPVQSTTIPPVRTLNAFIQLYFEYFDSQFPFLHYSVFDVDEPPWILVLAVAAIGSQYSQLTNIVGYTAALQELLRRAIAIYLPKPSARVELSFVQSVLLRDISLMFDGLQSAHLLLQTQRNMLITLCRWIATEEVAADASSHDLDRQYKLWLASESRNRLIYCVFRLECFQLILFDLPPLFQLEELTTRPLFGDDLWQCRTLNHWEACLRSKGGLHPFSAAVLPLQKNSSACENFAQEMHLVHLYVEERIVSDKLISSPLRKIYFTTSFWNNCAQEPGSNSRSLALHAPIMKFLTAFLDRELACYQPTRSSGPSGPQCAASLENLAHTFHILRRVPLKLLYTFTGWKSDEAEIAAAKNDLLSWMQVSTSAARACLWHAIVIHTSLSGKKHFACLDPYFFLISTLFIFAYDRFSPTPEATISRAMTSSAETPLMRFDRPTEQSKLEAWIAQKSEFRIYVPGIGALNGTESSTRLLEHARRILITRSGWQSLCQGIAGCIAQVIRGDRPSYPPEVQLGV